MKKYLILCFLCLVAGSCGDDEAYDTKNIVLDDETQQSLLFSEKAAFMRLGFQALEPWQASMINPGDGWCSISPGEGPVGKQTMLLKINENTTGADRHLTLILRAGSSRRDIQITQIGTEQLNLAQNSFKTGPKAGSFDVVVESNAPLEISGSGLSAPWLSYALTNVSQHDALTVYTYRITLTENEQDNERSCYLRFKGFNLFQEIDICQTGQADPAYYESTDYSADGKITRLQQATVGKGIDLIFLGDGFTDRLIRKGEYETWMRAGMEAFFAIEPYASLRDRFHVWYVSAVSRNQSYFEGSETALKCRIKNQSEIEGDDQVCKTYAQKIPNMTTERLDNTLIIVLLNTKQYAGTTYQYRPSKPTDYASGCAIAYCAQGSDKAMFTRLLQHEAGGHGFAKLADEYSLQAGTIPESEKNLYLSLESQGWYRNIDFTDDPQTVKWHRFLADPSYSHEALGIFEGACRYARGAFRPTRKHSMMLDNTEGYNAPSREAIYYRIQKLTHGDVWEYYYQAFVAFDQSISHQAPLRTPSAPTADTLPLPHTPPVVRPRPL